MAGDAENEERILILAPTGRDAQLLVNTLEPAAIKTFVCRDNTELMDQLNKGAAAAILAEEALKVANIALLSEWLLSQEPWSDLPFVVLTSGGRASVGSVKKANLLRGLGNVTLMERPVRPDTVLSAASAAIRGRLRQYDMRRRQALLTRVNMDLEQFAYSASHDLQEPLRNIAIYSDLIARRYGSVLDEQGKEFLGYLRSGATRMQLLVQDLLVYTQAASITDELPEPISAGDPLSKALSNLAESIRQSQAQILAEPLPRVRIQPVHLQQLFQNLIGNALKYRSEEQPRISIGAISQDGSWLFSVQDNGIGISNEHCERVFGLFKRLHTNEQYAGTGIGLAICRRIVERSRGKIWVESEPGSGSTFYFSLPA